MRMKHPSASYGVSKDHYDVTRIRHPRTFFKRGSTMLTTTLSQVEWVGGPVRVSLGREHRRAGAGSVHRVRARFSRFSSAEGIRVCAAIVKEVYHSPHASRPNTTRFRRLVKFPPLDNLG
jgi:hypothetical protein